MAGWIGAVIIITIVMIIVMIISLHYSFKIVKVLKDLFKHQVFTIKTETTMNFKTFTYTQAAKRYIPLWALFSYKDVQLEVPRASQFFFVIVFLSILWILNQIVIYEIDYTATDLLIAFYCSIASTAIAICITAILTNSFLSSFNEKNKGKLNGMYGTIDETKIAHAKSDSNKNLEEMQENKTLYENEQHTEYEFTNREDEIGKIETPELSPRDQAFTLPDESKNNSAALEILVTALALCCVAGLFWSIYMSSHMSQDNLRVCFLHWLFGIAIDIPLRSVIIFLLICFRCSAFLHRKFIIRNHDISPGNLRQYKRSPTKARDPLLDGYSEDTLLDHSPRATSPRNKKFKCPSPPTMSLHDVSFSLLGSKENHIESAQHEPKYAHQDNNMNKSDLFRPVKRLNFDDADKIQGMMTQNASEAYNTKEANNFNATNEKVWFFEEGFGSDEGEIEMLENSQLHKTIVVDNESEYYESVDSDYTEIEEIDSEGNKVTKLVKVDRDLSGYDSDTDALLTGRSWKKDSRRFTVGSNGEVLPSNNEVFFEENENGDLVLINPAKFSVDNNGHLIPIPEEDEYETDYELNDLGALIPIQKRLVDSPKKSKNIKIFKTGPDGELLDPDDPEEESDISEYVSEYELGDDGELERVMKKINEKGDEIGFESATEYEEISDGEWIPIEGTLGRNPKSQQFIDVQGEDGKVYKEPKPKKLYPKMMIDCNGKPRKIARQRFENPRLYIRNEEGKIVRKPEGNTEEVMVIGKDGKPLILVGEASKKNITKSDAKKYEINPKNLLRRKPKDHTEMYAYGGAVIKAPPKAKWKLWKAKKHIDKDGNISLINQNEEPIYKRGSKGEMIPVVPTFFGVDNADLYSKTLESQDPNKNPNKNQLFPESDKTVVTKKRRMRKKNRKEIEEEFKKAKGSNKFSPNYELVQVNKRPDKKKKGKKGGKKGKKSKETDETGKLKQKNLPPDDIEFLLNNISIDDTEKDAKLRTGKPPLPKGGRNISPSKEIKFEKGDWSIEPISYDEAEPEFPDGSLSKEMMMRNISLTKRKKKKTKRKTAKVDTSKDDSKLDELSSIYAATRNKLIFEDSKRNRFQSEPRRRKKRKGDESSSGSESGRRLTGRLKNLIGDLSDIESENDEFSGEFRGKKSMKKGGKKGNRNLERHTSQGVLLGDMVRRRFNNDSSRSLSPQGVDQSPISFLNDQSDFSHRKNRSTGANLKRSASVQRNFRKYSDENRDSSPIYNRNMREKYESPERRQDRMKTMTEFLNMPREKDEDREIKKLNRILKEREKVKRKQQTHKIDQYLMGCDNPYLEPQWLMMDKANEDKSISVIGVSPDKKSNDRTMNKDLSIASLHRTMTTVKNLVNSSKVQETLRSDSSVEKIRPL
ncbi:unnamed protein product [Blepharisma stoltei]|uniref:Uncharacterized protein n=1 Tax=Blepharisma stoltei TaxID=1481888 RepID=A0AAU9JX99_9CILI|nr:unnamed protein product [Blepharisma stoltei]